MTSKKIGRRFKKAPPKPHIPEGEYLASIIEAKEDHSFGTKLLIQFSVAYEGGKVILPFFASIKLDPETKEMLEPGPSTKLAKSLRRIFPGKSFWEMDLDDLPGISCQVRVASSKRDCDRNEKPLSEWYSVVNEVIRRSSMTTSINEGGINQEDDIPF